MHALINTMFGKMALLPWATLKKATNEKLWIICSYYGLDKAVCCPPNFKLIGSIGREPTELMRLLKEKDMKLYEWLQDAHAKKQDVIYITLGSMTPYEKCCVNTLYKGLESLGCRVVWSLKDQFRPLFDVDPDSNPNFWVRNWLP